jgi:hypothetical protein
MPEPRFIFADERVSFRHDAVRANGKRDDYVMVNHKKDAVTVCEMEIKDLMLAKTHR